MLFRFLYTIFLAGLFADVSAQPNINIHSDKIIIRTGEPDTVMLMATWPGHDLTQGFDVADSFPHFEVWDKGAVIKTPDGITQQIVVTGYDSGVFNLPPLPLMENQAFKTDSFAIHIQPLDVDSMKEYHDIKDIIEVPPVAQWPFILLISVVTLISLIGLFFLLQKIRTVKRTGKTGVSRETAFERAIAALEKLAQQATPQQPAKPFFVTLTHIYRQYLSEAYHWRSMQQTGGELILQARPLLNEPDFYQLTNAIRLGDAVKFAKYEPPVAEWQNALSVIRQTVTLLNDQLVGVAVSAGSPKK